MMSIKVVSIPCCKHNELDPKNVPIHKRFSSSFALRATWTLFMFGVKSRGAYEIPSEIWPKLITYLLCVYICIRIISKSKVNYSFISLGDDVEFWLLLRQSYLVYHFRFEVFFFHSARIVFVCVCERERMRWGYEWTGWLKSTNFWCGGKSHDSHHIITNSMNKIVLPSLPWQYQPMRCGKWKTEGEWEREMWAHK